MGQANADEWQNQGQANYYVNAHRLGCDLGQYQAINEENYFKDWLINPGRQDQEIV